MGSHKYIQKWISSSKPNKNDAPYGIENGLEQIIPGIPKLDQSREYFAFLKCEESFANICQLIGYGQGLWQQVEQVAQSNYRSNHTSQADSSLYCGSNLQNMFVGLVQLLNIKCFR